MDKKYKPLPVAKNSPTTHHPQTQTHFWLKISTNDVFFCPPKLLLLRASLAPFFNTCQGAHLFFFPSSSFFVPTTIWKRRKRCLCRRFFVVFFFVAWLFSDELFGGDDFTVGSFLLFGTVLLNNETIENIKRGRKMAQYFWRGKWMG